MIQLNKHSAFDIKITAEKTNIAQQTKETTKNQDNHNKIFVWKLMLIVTKAFTSQTLKSVTTDSRFDLLFGNR